MNVSTQRYGCLRAFVTHHMQLSASKHCCLHMHQSLQSHYRCETDESASGYMFMGATALFQGIRIHPVTVNTSQAAPQTPP
jgi:hypothetical protein